MTKRTYAVTAQKMNARRTPQSEAIPGREQDMVENNAGGHVFEVTSWSMLDRFLILGSEGGTYYASEQKITADNAKNVIKCIKADGERVVKRIVEISAAGRAPKNDPALFALALVMTYGDDAAKRAAYRALPEVARIGTHLLHLASYVDTMRGWGRGIRSAFGAWYTEQKPKALATNLVKYANRDGWTHRDVLRLSHPKALGVHQQLLAYAAQKPFDFNGTEVAAFMDAVEQIKSVKTPAEAAALISEHKLPREVVPTELLTSAEVWDALLPHMGTIAMVRNLANMTRSGLLTSTSRATELVLAKMENEEELKKAKIHPVQVMAALLTYKSGHGFRGSNVWTPVTKLVDGLDELFYRSFGIVVPTGKRVVYGLDISGSMEIGMIAGVPGFTPRLGVAVLAMLAARTEKNSVFLGFTNNGSMIRSSRWAGYNSGVTEIDITPKHRLDTVCKMMSNLPMGGTDCALPALWAAEKNVQADAFVIMTDNETWAGNIHPTQALSAYRKKMGIPAKLVVVGMTATQFSIADPSDAGQMDVVGFDTAAPNIISDFIRGDI